MGRVHCRATAISAYKTSLQSCLYDLSRNLDHRSHILRQGEVRLLKTPSTRLVRKSTPLGTEGSRGEVIDSRVPGDSKVGVAATQRGKEEAR